jgi:hypothetical protein
MFLQTLYPLQESVIGEIPGSFVGFGIRVVECTSLVSV